jgi:hypothetical protein
MSRYFFNISNNNYSVLDREGMELPNQKAAESQAITLASIAQSGERSCRMALITGHAVPHATAITANSRMASWRFDLHVAARSISDEIKARFVSTCIGLARSRRPASPQVPALHSITSSAVICMISGTVRS